METFRAQPKPRPGRAARIGATLFGLLCIVIAVIVITVVDQSGNTRPSCSAGEGAAVNGLNLPGPACP